MKKYNFSAGPSILPQTVFKKSSQAVLNFENMGLSLLEISHRSPKFIEVMDNARILVKELLSLSEDYEVLFLQGGASMQFLSIAYNLLENKAAYVNTGVWSTKAIEEAKALGQVEVIASSEDQKFNYIPKNIRVDNSYDYLHITTNNTIYGTQFHEIPECQVPLVADMSSDIMSRELDFSKFSLIYAGAQKNLGASGVTLVVVRKDILGNVSRRIPTLLNYQNQIKNDSLVNTPATFSVYVHMLTMQWLKDQGGLKTIEKLNNEKAKLLYEEIDRNDLFIGHAEKQDRSKMNVVFNLKDKTRENAFDIFWKEANISGLKGHRILGGYRASIYNAMSLEGVQILIDVMREFERKS